MSNAQLAAQIIDALSQRGFGGFEIYNFTTEANEALTEINWDTDPNGSKSRDDHSSYIEICNGVIRAFNDPPGGDPILLENGSLALAVTWTDDIEGAIDFLCSDQIGDYGWYLNDEIPRLSYEYSNLN